MGLFGPSKEEKEAFLAKIKRAKCLGTTQAQSGGPAFTVISVEYSFLIEFNDGTRTIYEGKASNDIIKGLLYKIDWGEGLTST